MNIENIVYKYGDNKISLNELIDSKEITKSENLILQKIFGLRNIRRFNKENHRELIIDIISILTGYISIENVRYLHVVHTSDMVSVFGKGLFDEVLKRFDLYNVNFFSSTAYNCSMPFLLLKHYQSIIKTLNINEKIILIICDIAYTGILKKIDGVTVMSDGVLGLILSKDNHSNLLKNIEIKTYEQFAKGIWDYQKNILVFQKKYTIYLYDVINTLLIKNNITINDIKLICPHNVNMFSWLELSRMLSVPKYKIFLNNVSDSGHAFGLDPFINLRDVLSQNLLSPGDYYILVSVGLGAVFAAALLQY